MVYNEDGTEEPSRAYKDGEPIAPPPSSPQSLDPRPKRRLDRDMKPRLLFALMVGCWEHTQMDALGRCHQSL